MFMERAKAALAEKPLTDLPSLEWAKEEQVTKLASSWKESCPNEVSAWIRTVRFYLEDEDTGSVLIPPLLRRVRGDYDEFREFVRRSYPVGLIGELLTEDEVSQLLNQIPGIKSDT